MRGIRSGLDAMSQVKRSSSDTLELLDTKRDVPSCRIKGEEGHWITLHSLYDPRGEADRWAQAADLGESEIIVVMGLGLGYHLQALFGRIGSNRTVLVVEKSHEVFQAAKGLFDDPGLCRPNLRFHVDQDLGEILQAIDRHRADEGWKGLRVLTHAPSVQSFPSYYRPLLQALQPGQGAGLKQGLEYPKFASSRVKVLLFDTGYYLVRELHRAFERNGDTVARLDLRTRRSDFIQRLLSVLATFKPDFILTVNHLGFDEGGRLGGLLSSLEIPFAVWYVDSPTYILREPDRHLSAFLSLFSWERSYLSTLTEMGFDQVHHLPLATDPDLFCPAGPVPARWASYHGRIAFVGNSMVEAVRSWEKRAGLDPSVPWASEAMAVQEKKRNVSMEAIVAEIRRGQPTGKDTEAALVWRATLRYRLRMIQALLPMGVDVFGDLHWKGLLPEGTNLHGHVDYYRELPHIYRASAVNLNATSFQMNSAVNQRVFDVPACGGFLLTDRPSDMAALFDLGTEAICYESEEDLKEKAVYYLDRPEERRRIAQRGLRRILQEHTYTHRVRSMVAAMRRRFAGA